MNKEIKITYPDYKKIREESYRIDCTVTQADFNTNHPNPYRLEYMISDFNRYLKRKNGGRCNGIKY